MFACVLLLMLVLVARVFSRCKVRQELPKKRPISKKNVANPRFATFLLFYASKVRFLDLFVRHLMVFGVTPREIYSR